MITVLTPTYNRASLLINLYQSLIKQDFGDFEWIIVDDGSVDATTDIVNQFIKEGQIVITYIKQANGGKHRALNRGVKEAKGELVLIVDSDDSLPINSLSIIYSHYLDIKDNSSIGGVCGLMAHHDGTIIGERKICSSMNLSSMEMRYKYGFVGDVCEVFKTEILREFPFPEIENEKFCPEDLIWNRISKKYKLLFFNNVVYYRDYLEGGLTSKIIKIRMESPIASTICYGEMLDFEIPFSSKIKAAINYWRFYFCIKNKSNIRKILSALWFFLFPIGWFFHVKDLVRVR